MDMYREGDLLQLSASDLVGHLNCRHLTDLEHGAASGTLQRPYRHDPLLDILAERGSLHERDYLQSLSSAGYEVVQIEGVGIVDRQINRTMEAMRTGYQIIAQGALRQGAWGGRPDILRRVTLPSALGDWSYEVIDTKLARETRGGTVLQLSLYSDLLSTVQRVTPEYMYVVTPGSGAAPVTFRTAAYAAYYRHVRRRLEESLQSGGGALSYPEPKDHCDTCRWYSSCTARWHRDDHLCLVAGITKVQMSELRRRDVDTLAKLARVPLPLPWKPGRGAKASYERCREQARVQLGGREAGQPVYETLALEMPLGLYRLPQPDPGDLFLDLEGDPFVAEGGLEFLFGYASMSPEGTVNYVGAWAFGPEQESAEFQRLVDLIVARWAQHPSMHVYHYSAYEPAAVKRLMGRYATREDEVDRMLRGGLFVDLYSIVKQSLRASVESYSIKNLEVFYRYARSVPLLEVRRALAHVQGCLELNAAADIPDEAKELVERYNRDDCLSVACLRDWLEGIRQRLVEEGADIVRPAPEPPEPTEEVSERQRKVAELVALLSAEVPADAAQRTAEQQARWILANTLDWHRREQKAVWWEYFRLADLSTEDLLDEREALSGLTFIGAAGGSARAPVHRYSFPPQEVELSGGEPLHSVGGAKFGKLEAISTERRTVDIKKRQDTAQSHPKSVFAHDVVSTEVMADALFRIGESVATTGLSDNGAHRAARDLLLRRPPQTGGEPLRREGESTVQAAIRITLGLQSGVLPIQGPPGAGKTFTASRMICELVKAGKRIGVTANSHKVIRNLLDEVVRGAEALGVDVQCIQKLSDKQEEVPRMTFSNSNEAVLAALAGKHQVAGGTAWFWSRPEAFEAVDVLFVDEAAQMSLANVLAVSQACQALVLVGDPQQLEQPSAGSHPDGTDASALDYLLNGKATIGREEGLFLEETWRLPPEICAFTSELFYEGRLHSRAGAERQAVKSVSRVCGSGLRYLPVPHQGNQSSSPEEADRIYELVEELLGASATWVNRDGVEQLVALKDILIVAPYNAQVIELQERLPAARIGTVDKFQGQEAPIVIYSLTTSSYADAPRGMEFLYSLNRLNVATSRAQCVCVLVASPAIFEPECHTPRQIQLANGFCRYLEIATVLPAAK
jgi:predicted RecB family nuclease